MPRPPSMNVPIDWDTTDLAAWAAAYDAAVADFPDEMNNDAARLSWFDAMIAVGRRHPPKEHQR